MGRMSGWMEEWLPSKLEFLRGSNMLVDLAVACKNEKMIKKHSCCLQDFNPRG